MENLSEHQEQVLVVKHCDAKNILAFAIPNAGKRSMITASILKAEGMKSGVPDLFIPIAKNGYHGLFIEMKKVKGGTVSDTQKVWLEALNKNGYLAVVARGHAEAIKIIEEYVR